MEEVFRAAISSGSLRWIGDGVLNAGLRAGILCSSPELLEVGGGVFGEGGGAVGDSVLVLLVMFETEFLVDNDSGVPETCEGVLVESLILLVTRIIPFLMAIL